MSKKAIEIKNLVKCFGERRAVDGLCLDINEGEFFTLLGQNGAGKTTSIKMLCCLIPPTDGDALVFGKSIVNDSQCVKAMQSVAPQETAVAPLLSVKENLELMAMVYGKSKQQAREKAVKIAEALKLSDRMKDKAGTLSGGLQRRLSIAMALISEPKILYIDEPTLGLDVRARRELWKQLESLHGRVTIIMTTHYLEEAKALSDRIGVMHMGALRAVGTAEEIMELAGKDNLEDAFLSLTDADINELRPE